MIALTYGSGLPLMYPIAAVAVTLASFDAKLKFQRMWRKPRNYGPATTQLFSRYFKVMIYVHICVGAWMQSYFTTTKQDGAHCSPRHAQACAAARQRVRHAHSASVHRRSGPVGPRCGG